MSDTEKKPNPTGRLTKWKPKKWRPEYDRIVAYSVMGKSNVWIAKQLDFTPVHVSNILNQPQAIELADKLHQKLRANLESDIPSVLTDVAQKTAKLMQRVIDDEVLVQKNPFAIIDRGMEVLKGLGHLKTGAQQGGNTFNGPTVVLTAHQNDAIASGLEKLQQIKVIHGGEPSSSNGDKE